MSNAGLGLRDPLEREEARPTSSRNIDNGAVPAAARPAAARQSSDAYAPRAPRPYASARARIDADGVRTVKIRGQATPPRRRPLVDVSRPMMRYDQHPDRAAQWALFLGVFMVIVAIVTGS